MTVKELRAKCGMTQLEFSRYFGFSKQSVCNWEQGVSAIAPYCLALMEYKLRNEGLID